MPKTHWSEFVGSRPQVPKALTAQKLLALPTAMMTITDIKQALGVTHQRVHQLIDELMLPYKRKRNRKGTVKTVPCAVCGTPVTRGPSHFRPGAKACCSLYCGRRSRLKPTVTLTCLNCGVTFPRKTYIKRNKRDFCTWACWIDYHKREKGR